MKNKKKVHFAGIFPISSEKGSGLLEGDPDRKFKGRCVVQGNDVRDENAHAAIFQELSSSPATLEAAKSVDAYGCMKGNETQQCDAQQAYVQSELGGIETWISLPKILGPESWAQYYEPVCILKLALYGHPDAGGYWERHCEEHLTSIGFAPVPDCRSTYWHPELKLFLMVYVDDFKMSGPSANFAKGWSMIRQKVKTDEPRAVTKCLGCEHLVCDTNVGVCRSNKWNITCDHSPSNVWIATSHLLKRILILLSQPRHLSWMSLKLRTPLVTIKKVYQHLLHARFL